MDLSCLLFSSHSQHYCNYNTELPAPGLRRQLKGHWCSSNTNTMTPELELKRILWPEGKPCQEEGETDSSEAFFQHSMNLVKYMAVSCV